MCTPRFSERRTRVGGGRRDSRTNNRTYVVREGCLSDGSYTIGVGYYYNCSVWKKWEPRNVVVFVQNRRMAMRRLKRARDLRVRREVGPRDRRRRRRRRERRYRTMERCVRGGVYAANRAGDRNNNRGNIITGSWGGGRSSRGLYSYRNAGHRA